MAQDNNIQDLEKSILNVMDEYLNIDGALESIAIDLEQSFRDNINSGGKVGKITGENDNFYAGGNSRFTSLSKMSRTDNQKPTLIGEGKLIRSINTLVDYANNTIKIGSNLPYSRIHQIGGTIKTSITPKSRKYFWYMFYKTNIQMFKNMALTKKDFFIINIPARPYITVSEETIINIEETLFNYFSN